VDITKVDENIIDVASNNLDSEIIKNNTSINSNSDCRQLQKTTPSSKQTPKPLSAKKQEERLRIKQVSYLYIVDNIIIIY